MNRKRQGTKAKPRLPRAPLPKKTEQTHEDKSKRTFRKDKHRKRWLKESD